VIGKGVESKQPRALEIEPWSEAGAMCVFECVVDGIERRRVDKAESLICEIAGHVELEESASDGCRRDVSVALESFDDAADCN
jgi:hypothetical protein